MTNHDFAKFTLAFILFNICQCVFAKDPFFTLMPTSNAVSVDIVEDANTTSPLSSTEEGGAIQVRGDSVGCKDEMSISERKQAAIKRYLSVCLPLKTCSISSGYGKRKNPLNPKKSEDHKGVDLKCNNAEVYSIMCGEVSRVGFDSRSGNYVTVRYGDYTVSFCHLSKAACAKGDFVKPGQVIAVSGNTGRSTGPHLHLTVKFNGHHIDPNLVIGWIKSIQAEARAELLALACMELEASDVQNEEGIQK